MKEIVVYTDGSAAVAGKMAGCGGFGTYFPDLFGKKKAFSLGFSSAKTGQMEVLALLFAIKAMPEACLYPVQLRIYSDSEYIVKSFTEGRLLRWEKNNWINSCGSVKNEQLWKNILYELRRRKYLSLFLHHIKSHQYEKAVTEFHRKQLLKDPTIIGNMMADRLADYKRHTILQPSVASLGILKKID